MCTPSPSGPLSSFSSVLPRKSISFSDMTAPAMTTREPWDAQALRNFLIGTALVVFAVLGGILVGQAAMLQQSAVLVVPAIPLLLVAIWKKPLLTAVLALGSGLLFEQFPYEIGTHPGPFTAHVAMFRSIGNGVVTTPMEILLFVGVLIWVMRAALTRRLDFPRSAISKTLVVFWLLLLVGLGVGM